MKSIFYYKYAKKRMEALHNDMAKLEEENPMMQAQEDMIKLEIEYYREQSIKFLITMGFVIIGLAVLSYVYIEDINKFIGGNNYHISCTIT